MLNFGGVLQKSLMSKGPNETNAFDIQPKGLFISGPFNLSISEIESLGEFPEIHRYPIAYLGEFPEVLLKLGLVYLVIPVLSRDIITTQSSFARNLF